MKKESFYYLILINIIILLLIEILKFFIPNEVMLYLLFGAQYGPLVSSGQWYRIVTAMFVHGGFIHLVFNMYALYFLGRIVENVYGTDKFLFFYFSTGIIGNLATQFFYYNSFSVGASGAIFGLVGVLFAAGFRRDTPYTLKPITGTAFLPMILVNIFLGFIPGSNINNAAHLGGFLSGMALGYFIPIYEYSWNIRKLWKILSRVLVGVIIVSYIFLIIEGVKG
ncbi:Rhomboid family protein [Thermosipho melanesiensis]|uniref:Rhomboid family protein n=2 Tax=Thermosipho melanesiensis TaxID=46541 RepID=A6LKF9_THEM4|nr:rhomboid family intramembrane serine protease [Thermosipho melanesiensis]ABR30410.1 Rhomboid family protein [Thermosipho melanesiensis BI429]APT73570.1 Rhomboid family protein [Thermosipho melanesiensis]OOC37521.1 Rhomboid family protein [Thermosipho melanesiensis]OOC39417.1 Rhomboid family protein [Thermosipho melanesiensis]OOC39480.1 Rhomboid family protein [Thermosipho melanesiensis]